MGGKLLQAPQDAGSEEQQTLLIVDDDVFMLDVLSDFLAQDGYRILTAQTAAEGFDILARHKVQVILCDQCMPLMSGTEFMERVKNLCPDTFRIMLSAYADLTPIMAAINHGADRPLLHQAVEGRRAAREHPRRLPPAQAAAWPGESGGLRSFPQRVIGRRVRWRTLRSSFTSN